MDIIKVKISKEENPSERWYLYTVKLSEEDIDKLSRNIKESWYMHFWQDRNIIAIFKEKKFEFNYDDKSACKLVFEYGLSIGISKEQLDFPID